MPGRRFFQRDAVATRGTGSPRGLAAVCLALILLVGCTGKQGPSQQAIDQSRAQALYRLGLRYYQDGNYRGAYAELLKAVDLEPKNALYWNSLGLVAFELGQYENAEDQLTRALRLDPALTDAHMQLGVVYSEMGKFELAEQQFHRALQDPAYLYPHRVYVNWGVSLLKQDNVAGAEAKFRQAIDASPRYARAHYELARLMQQEGDLEGALQEYREAWKDMPDVPELNLRLGQVYLGLGDGNQARVYFEKVISVAPGSTQAGEARDYLEKIPSR